MNAATNNSANPTPHATRVRRVLRAMGAATVVNGLLRVRPDRIYANKSRKRFEEPVRSLPRCDIDKPLADLRELAADGAGGRVREQGALCDLRQAYGCRALAEARCAAVDGELQAIALGSLDVDEGNGPLNVALKGPTFALIWVAYRSSPIASKRWQP